MKRKRAKAALTKEQQAATEGWVYISGSKVIRGWNSLWVEGSREGRGEAEGTIRRPYIPSPTGSVHPDQIALYTDTWRERG